MRSAVLLLVLLVCAQAFAQSSKPEPAPPIHPIRWYNSRPMTMKDLRGRVVLLGFWATWSKPSVDSHRQLIALADALKSEQFSVILYHSRMTNIQHIHDVKAEKVLPFFIAENRLKLPVAIAGERDFAEFGVIGLPRFVLVDKRGAIRVSAGKVPTVKQIRSLLAENVPNTQQAVRPKPSARSGSRATAPGGQP
jgi:thiol-disulfide isomerase/thioredoxin